MADVTKICLWDMSTGCIAAKRDGEGFYHYCSRTTHHRFYHRCQHGVIWSSTDTENVIREEQSSERQKLSTSDDLTDEERIYLVESGQLPGSMASAEELGNIPDDLDDSVSPLEKMEIETLRRMLKTCQEEYAMTDAYRRRLEAVTGPARELVEALNGDYLDIIGNTRPLRLPKDRVQRRALRGKREALAHALYKLDHGIEIRHAPTESFPDRLEIASPGLTEKLDVLTDTL